VDPHSEPWSYRSPVPFVAERIGAAAVYCSDGRFGDQVDDLLHNALHLPRYDRLALPGGPACLTGRFLVYQEADALLRHLRFLFDVHQLDRLVFIAHQDCAFYSRRLQISPAQLEREQCDDLHQAIQRVTSLFGCGQADAFFARLCENGQVQFERV
jgi:hypothetical protein